MAALGVLTVLFAVWAAAVSRPEPVIPGLRTGTQVRQRGADDGVFDGEADLGLKRVPGPWEQTGDTLAMILGWATIVFLATGAGIALYLLVRALVSGHEPRTPEADDAPDLDLEALAMAVTTDASQRLDALSAGTPAQGIIAAWAHLEATLHEAGVPLAPSRTSSEVTLDVLRRFAVDPETLRALAGLYREARFSAHPLTEDDRARAAAAYRTLDADLRAGMPGASHGRRG